MGRYVSLSPAKMPFGGLHRSIDGLVGEDLPGHVIAALSVKLNVFITRENRLQLVRLEHPCRLREGLVSLPSGCHSLTGRTDRHHLGAPLRHRSEVHERLTRDGRPDRSERDWANLMEILRPDELQTRACARLGVFLGPP